MTAANNGAGTPEDDDPFGYLYEDGQQAGATPPGQGRGGYGYPGPAPQPGVPRTSYNQVRTVGERRQYAQQVPPQQQGGYGYPPPQQPYGQQGYGRPTAAYAAPETYPGAPNRQTAAMPSGGPVQGGRGRGGGPNTRGLLIGAIAVVAVVVIGIGAALMTGGDGEDDAKGDPGAGTSPTAAESVKPSEPPSKKPDAPAELPKQDAATLTLGGPAATGTDVPGAKGTGGAYVMFNGEGGSASWSVEVPEAGPYTMYLTYSVPGKDAKTSLTINGQQPREINMSNFAKAAEGDWEKGWTNTYSFVELEKGKNDLRISCEAGNQCEAYLDQVWLEAGHKKKSG